MLWVRRVMQAVVVATLAVVPVACAPIYVASCQNKLVTTTAGPITDPALTEISGIHTGVRNPGVWWVHNDSGDTARVFALDGTGAVRGTYSLTGATAVDWEDIAVVAGPTPGSGTIYAGDIGDNALARSEIQVYRVAEPEVPATGPAVTTALSGVETLHLTYPDGPHDAETLLVDPATGDILVITKLLLGGTVGIYRAAAPLAAGSTTQLTEVDTLTYPSGLANAVTGGDVSADGTAIVIRTYGNVRVYNRAGGATLWGALRTPACTAPLPSEGQGEAVGFNPAATSLVTVSEGANQSLHFSSVP
jgi:hypothetical protein